MTCPGCYTEVDDAQKRCPDCGMRLYRNISGVMKTSAVMISAGGSESFYQSVRDVPEPLRRQLLASTASENAGTIVIADRAGREQLTQVLGAGSEPRKSSPPVALPPPAQAAALPAAPDIAEKIQDALGHLSLSESLAAGEAPRSPGSSPRPRWIAWAGVAFVLGGAAAFWLFFGLRG